MKRKYPLFRMRTKGPRAEIVVLQAVAALDDKSNPYLWQLVESLPPKVECLYFSWGRALASRYSVLHVHWPEAMLRGGTPLRSGAKRLLTECLLLRLRLTRTPIVRTIHNPAPHEAVSSRWEKSILGRLDRQTRLSIALNEHTPPLSSQTKHVVIPHGHYREWFRRYAIPGPVRGHLLFFGLIRPYKRVDALIRAVRSAEGVVSGALKLRIRGAVQDAPLRETLETLAGTSEAVDLRFGHLSDSELASEIGQSELVVLPYRELHNSGALILALSLGRPVLVPYSLTASDLAVEVGPGWVFTYEGELESLHIEQALVQTRSFPIDRPAPDLSGRDWARLGLLLAESYTVACGPSAKWSSH